MSHRESKSFKLGRDAITGRFVPIEKTRKNPDRYIVEHVPKSGFGDVDNKRPKPPRLK